MHFPALVKALHARFALIATHSPHLYTTDIDADLLWTAYLAAFGSDDPIFKKRQGHDCSCCRQFIKRMGGVVGIGPDGQVLNLWSLFIPEEPVYQRVVDRMSALVNNSEIDGVFLSDTKRVGTSHNFGQIDGEARQFNHFYLDLPQQYVVRRGDVDSTAGRLRTQRETLDRALRTLSPTAIDDVLDLISANNLYRGAEHKPALVQFKTLQKAYIDAPNKSTFAWRHLNDRSHGLRNSAIGTLLVDLSEGRDLESAVKAFEDKVAPTNYKRPKSVVTAKMVEQAKTTVAELGLTDALARRQAVLDDVSINNVLFADRSASRQMKDSDPFAVATKPSKKTFDKARTVSIADFIKDVLPTATSVELLLENKHRPNLVTLITALIPDAPRLFHWNNPFSWSYTGDVTDAIKERVKAAGGNVTGDVCIRLAWNNYDDLDLHVVLPTSVRARDRYGSGTIWFRQRLDSVTGGNLDVDMNASHGHTREPVENIVFPDRSKMLPGVYRVRVHQFSPREAKDNTFTVDIDIGGEITSFGSLNPSRDAMLEVADIVVRENGAIEVQPIMNASSSYAKKTFWGVETGDFRRVNAVMRSPNYWDDERGHGNEHVFFMLDGCVADEDARGFYNEFLRSELAPHRKVLELVGSKQRVESVPNQLSGVGFSVTSGAVITVRVTGQSVTQILNVQF